MERRRREESERLKKLIKDQQLAEEAANKRRLQKIQQDMSDLIEKEDTDRARIEEEFRSRAETIKDPSYSINLRRAERFTTLPPALAQKVLTDVLNTWAEQAQSRKGVLRYQFARVIRCVTQSMVRVSPIFMLSRAAPC